MIFRFGLFEVDTESDQVLKSGRAVKIQQQPYKLLCLLLARAGKVVTRDDIRAALTRFNPAALAEVKDELKDDLKETRS